MIDLDNLRYWWTAALDPDASTENEDRIAKEIRYLSEQCIEFVLGLTPIPWCATHNASWITELAGCGHDQEIERCRLEDPQAVYRIEQP